MVRPRKEKDELMFRHNISLYPEQARLIMDDERLLEGVEEYNKNNFSLKIRKIVDSYYNTKASSGP